MRRSNHGLDDAKGARGYTLVYWCGFFGKDDKLANHILLHHEVTYETWALIFFRCLMFHGFISSSIKSILLAWCGGFRGKIRGKFGGLFCSLFFDFSIFFPITDDGCRLKVLNTYSKLERTGCGQTIDV